MRSEGEPVTEADAQTDSEAMVAEGGVVVDGVGDDEALALRDREGAPEGEKESVGDTVALGVVDCERVDVLASEKLCVRVLFGEAEARSEPLPEKQDEAVRDTDALADSEPVTVGEPEVEALADWRTDADMERVRLNVGDCDSDAVPHEEADAERVAIETVAASVDVTDAQRDALMERDGDVLAVEEPVPDCELLAAGLKEEFVEALVNPLREKVGEEEPDALSDVVSELEKVSKGVDVRLKDPDAEMGAVRVLASASEALAVKLPDTVPQRVGGVEGVEVTDDDIEGERTPDSLMVRVAAGLTEVVLEPEGEPVLEGDGASVEERLVLADTVALELTQALPFGVAVLEVDALARSVALLDCDAVLETLPHPEAEGEKLLRERVAVLDAEPR